MSGQHASSEVARGRRREPRHYTGELLPFNPPPIKVRALVRELERLNERTAALHSFLTGDLHPDVVRHFGLTMTELTNRPLPTDPDVLHSS